MKEDLIHAFVLATGGLLGIFSIPWLIETSPQSQTSHGILPVCRVCICVQIFSFYMDFCHMELRSTLMTSFNLIRSYSKVMCGRTLTHFWRGHNSSCSSGIVESKEGLTHKGKETKTCLGARICEPARTLPPTCLDVTHFHVSIS